MKPPILRSAAEKGQNTVDDWPHSLQGIPVMPRMDTGDAFDRILQRWIENGADSVPHSSSQQMDYKGTTAAYACVPTNILHFSVLVFTCSPEAHPLKRIAMASTSFSCFSSDTMSRKVLHALM